MNRFQPTPYMLVKGKKDAKVPRLIERVIRHALGDDEESFDHMMNYLACLLRYRKKLGTAWVMHGIQGTGKGLFFNAILKPLFSYAVMKRTRQLNTEFNGDLEACLILWIDEAEIALHRESNAMEGDLKNYITEPNISIRRMHTLPYEVPSFLNVFLASNKGEIIHIDPSDRRFNVAPFQKNKLEITKYEADVEIFTETMAFAEYLMAYPADLDRARIPMNNEAKQKMAYMTESSIDGICKAILNGDIKLLEGEKPADHLTVGNSSKDIMAGAYINLIDNIKACKRKVLNREEIQLILEYTCGGVPQTSFKFTSFLKHHGIFLEPMSQNGKTVRGIKVEWKHD